METDCLGVSIDHGSIADAAGLKVREEQIDNHPRADSRCCEFIALIIAYTTLEPPKRGHPYDY